jgi:hypothetical protein
MLLELGRRNSNGLFSVLGRWDVKRVCGDSRTWFRSRWRVMKLSKLDAVHSSCMFYFGPHRSLAHAALGLAFNHVARWAFATLLLFWFPCLGWLG